MHDTLETIKRYIQDHYLEFGLSSVDQLKLVENPSQSLPDGAQWLQLIPRITNTQKAPSLPYDPSQSSLGKHHLVTLLELKCSTHNPNPTLTPDFGWEQASNLRDKTIQALTNSSSGGLVIPRYIWTDPGNPVVSGEIWFEVSSASPTEEYCEDLSDANNKSISLLCNVHWWKPAGIAISVSADPWLDALISRTQNLLGANWTIIQEGTPETNLPSVAWRLEKASSRCINKTLAEITREYQGEILASDSNLVSYACTSITQGLSQEGKILIDSLTNKYLTLPEVSSRPREKDPLSQVITVKLQQKISNFIEQGPLITAVHHKAIL